MRYGWLLFALVELGTSMHSGTRPNLTMLIALVALLTISRLQPTFEEVGRAARLVLSAGVLLCLAMAVLRPGVARYVQTEAHWFSRDARLAGVFATPNEVGNLASLSVVLWLAHAPRNRRAARIMVLTSVIVLALSQSYTAWIACAFGVLLVLIMRKGGAAVLWRLIAVLLVLALPSTLPSLAHSDNSATSGLDERGIAWHFVGQHWREHELLGHGVGIWSKLIDANVIPTWAVHAHDQVLNTLFVAGLVGVLALVLVALAMIGPALSLARQGKPALLGVLGLEAVRSYTEVPFEVLFGGINLFLVCVLMGWAADGARARDPLDGPEHSQVSMNRAHV